MPVHAIPLWFKKLAVTVRWQLAVLVVAQPRDRHLLYFNGLIRSI